MDHFPIVALGSAGLRESWPPNPLDVLESWTLDHNYLEISGVDLESWEVDLEISGVDLETWEVDLET